LSQELDADPVLHAPDHPAVSDNTVSDGHELKLFWHKITAGEIERGTHLRNVDD
jgi:hypothetical protein